MLRASSTVGDVDSSTWVDDSLPMVRRFRRLGLRRPMMAVEDLAIKKVKKSQILRLLDQSS